MRDRRTFSQNIIAVVYDFDGTLSPQPMQEYTVLPSLGIDAQTFWDEVAKEAKETDSEGMLVYMRLLLEKTEERKAHIGKNDLAKLAVGIKYFPGVESWFTRINDFVKKESGGKTKIRHYVISAGMKEILEGVSIRKYFFNVFASEYHFNHHGVATFPKQLITDTSKTQFLFRINKGKEKLSESINQHTPEYKRPIPFSNIIYIGDGLTDVPSMTVTKQLGGYAVAVHKKQSTKGVQVCKELLAANRVDFIAPADYSVSKILETRMHLLLKSVISKINYERELFKCKRKNELLPSNGT
jgi:2-hydroxy-3-keto-5-methylthiopentenyl-1-phosphate phosphatase